MGVRAIMRTGASVGVDRLGKQWVPGPTAPPSEKEEEEPEHTVQEFLALNLKVLEYSGI